MCLGASRDFQPGAMEFALSYFFYYTNREQTASSQNQRQAKVKLHCNLHKNTHVSSWTTLELFWSIHPSIHVLIPHRKARVGIKTTTFLVCYPRRSYKRVYSESVSYHSTKNTQRLYHPMIYPPIRHVAFRRVCQWQKTLGSKVATLGIL